MPNNQGGLNSIESISGVQAPVTSAVERVPQIGDYNFTRTQQANNNNSGATFGLLTQHTTVPFSSKSLDLAFYDANIVGINPFGDPVVQRNKALSEGKGFNLYGLA